VLLATKSVEASAAGYLQLLAWLRSSGGVDRVGVESTGSYAAGLTRHLVGAGIRVLEVNQPHAHTRRRRGKTDAIDAELAARHALGLVAQVTPKQTTGIVDAIRQLRVARDSAVKSRSVAILQLGDLLLTAPSELHEQLARRKTLKGKATLCRRLRPDASRLDDPLNAANLALRSLARRVVLLDSEIAELDAQLAPLVATAAPRTTALLGISTGHAGQLLLTAGQNIDRLRSEGAFAALCGGRLQPEQPPLTRPQRAQCLQRLHPAVARPDLIACLRAILGELLLLVLGAFQPPHLTDRHPPIKAVRKRTPGAGRKCTPRWRRLKSGVLLTRRG
jgi:transposase